MAGSARFRLMFATMTIVRLRHSTPSVRHRLAYTSGSMPPRSTPSPPGADGEGSVPEAAGSRVDGVRRTAGTYDLESA